MGWARWLALLLICMTLPVSSQPLVPQAAPSPRVTELRLQSSPPGARVYDRNYSSMDPDESSLGQTPLSLPLDRNVSHTLWVTRDGYSLERVVVNASSGDVPAFQNLMVQLAPARLDTWLWSHPEGLLSFLLLSAVGVVWVKTRYHRLEVKLVDALLSDPGLLGRVVGDYRLIAKIGEGGFSTVYLAEHVEYGERFALKLLKSDILTPTAIERFNREMQLGRDLKHPGLVRVWACGTYEDRPYLVMDMVEGKTLSEEQATRSPVQLLELFIKVCQAVQALHDSGLVHRDLKPDNVMVLPDGSVRVLDFGAAKQMNRKGLTVTGTTLGTPLFMSPEHLDAKGVDQRSDVYSAGVILYFLMTGHTPFEAESTMEVLLAHLDKAPPELALSGLGAELEPVVQRMLAKSPSARYPTMGQVIRDLLPILDRMKLQA